MEQNTSLQSTDKTTSVLFDDIDLKNVYKTIHTNVKSRKKTIDDQIQSINNKIESFSEEATKASMTDNIRKLIDSSIKNDDMLIRLMQTHERLARTLNDTAPPQDDYDDFNDEERYLMKKAEELLDSIENLE